MSHIRPAGLYDLPGTYRVCLQTADAGGDGSALFANPDLLGHIYVGPYLVGAPDFAWVIADELGVAGYVLGAADTRQFEAWQEREWWPVLRSQYAPTAGASLDDELISHLHTPVLAPDSVVANYPAHLHIDLLPRAQGRGFGRSMLETLFAALRARGVTGIHLDVGEDNHNAIAFYRHLGFVELARGADSIYLGMELS
ncbi:MULTISPECIES: GNAT family N-acetyltransferase [unclassified Salinibacterium]|uniref:GNAT family N-acetyltransferase n=1 Tax=unclassified Salinibacterium TaxID=2632331 RepID=UPI0018CD0734|nr:MULTISPECIES: GNAT family N-acetyltransferase [unclassified Salinibacterium]MBH0052840.1 GNAT family N-acetyltransferase [Salinibacterium sp. SWN139]MBH0082101.1 GNAT family N-acetyltransferase [Salinibacterium sp. SWN167]